MSDMHVIESNTAEVFRFKIQGQSDVYELPLMQFLPVKVVRSLSKIQKDSDDEHRSLDMVDFIISLLDMYAPGLTDKITQAELVSIFEAWSDASSAQLGES